MTVRVELDYDKTAWDNAAVISRIIATDWEKLAESRRDGHRCYQQVVISHRDHYLMTHATNAYHVTAWDIAKKLSWVPLDLLIEKYVPPHEGALLDVIRDDPRFNELIRAGDLPALSRHGTDALVRSLI